MAEVLITLGQILRAQGNVEVAYEALTEALRIALAMGLRLLVAALEALAELLISQRESHPTVQFLAAASALRVQMGAPVRPVDQAAVEQTLATARSALGADTFAAVWAETQALPLEQILSTIPSAAAFSISAAPLDTLPSTTNRPPPA